MRRKNILFMGAPGVGVGTCMRMVEPVLMVLISIPRNSIDSILSIKVLNSEGNATGYRVWTNC